MPRIKCFSYDEVSIFNRNTHKKVDKAAGINKNRINLKSADEKTRKQEGSSTLR